jgi:ABC-type polar amino acid transport system ATPase subunit
VEKRYGPVKVISGLNLTNRRRRIRGAGRPLGLWQNHLAADGRGPGVVSSGRLFIGGRDVTDVAPKSRDIAMVFQSYALFPHMNVFDNIAFGLKFVKVPKAEMQSQVNGSPSA